MPGRPVAVLVACWIAYCTSPITQSAARHVEICARRVVALRIARPRVPPGCRLNRPTSAVSASVGLARSADARGRQRIGRAARRQIDGRQGRPAEARVDEQVLVFGGDEFEVGALLADLDVELAAPEALLEPELVEPGRRVGLDAADDVRDCRGWRPSGHGRGSGRR